MVADCDYVWDYPKGFLRRRPMSWPRDRFALVDFTHGYDDCPPDLKVLIAGAPTAFAGVRRST
ncbi:MAG: hypothetical protein ACRDT5_19860 [Mycobacterium sp.]